MKKNAKLAALAILVLAAVAALSVGITLAVVNARMPAACTCSGQCRSAGTETAADVDAPSAQQTEPSEADSISIPGFDFLSLQAGAQEQSILNHFHKLWTLLSRCSRNTFINILCGQSPVRSCRQNWLIPVKLVTES